MSTTVRIGNRLVGSGQRTWIVAEMSGNHLGSLDRAIGLMRAAYDAGAEAIKIQCMEPSSMTIDSDALPFRLRWQGQDTTLWRLYQQTATPWEWLPALKAEADRLGIILFPSVFAVQDISRVAVIDPPVYKVASFELSDTPLIRALARQGKPLIISTGMATQAEIQNALQAADRGVRDRVRLPANRFLRNPPEVALLKCTSAYPATVGDANLLTIRDHDLLFQTEIGWRSTHSVCPVGLSDHSRSNALVSAAVALGACLVERHFTLDRSAGGPDAAFSDEPAEFAAMVRCIRDTEAALGSVHYGPTESERPMLRYRRSLWVVQDIPAGGKLTPENVRCLRPADGLSPSEYPQVLGRTAAVEIKRGTPLSWEVLV